MQKRIKIMLVMVWILSQSASLPSQIINQKSMEKATLGAGCFWCVEAILQRLNGVESVTPGYSGGTIANPSYREVKTGNTGHVEVARVVFDPEIITFDEILEVFWKTHDPTQLNRQGADIGTQYRSVIFYHNEAQKEIATAYKKKLDDAAIWDKPIVTAIEPLKNFYEAEAYHQDYYNNNKTQGYCQFVITPKIEKFKKIFKDKLK
jgi:peptide-methionine (S)-S-oxide reductase